MPTVEPCAGLSLTIGAVSRATGVPANTLRTWERRYGFPRPLRTEGGQRLYPASIVPHLVAIARAVERGVRPREALLASREELDRWIGNPGEGAVEELLGAVRALDPARLGQRLRMAWAEQGGVRCMDDVVLPLERALCEERRKGHLGELEMRFGLEELRAFLDGHRAVLVPSVSGPTVLCAAPPGFGGELGLRAVTLTFALAGWRVLCIGRASSIDQLERAVSRVEPAWCVLPAWGTVEGHAADVVRRLPVAVSIVGPRAPSGEPACCTELLEQIRLRGLRGAG